MAELVTITDGNVTATVDSQGAQLMSLATAAGEYLWQGDEKFWPRRAPVLFPIVGCLRGGHATSAAGEVTLERHGIARLYDHKVVSHTPSSVTFELASNEETRAAYPFDFALNMTFSVADGRLAQTFAVTNTGAVDLPFTLGGHPAFNVPAPGAEGEKLSDYALVFPHAWTAETPTLDTDGLCDFGRMNKLFEGADRLPLTYALFERLLTLTFTEVPGRSVQLVGPAGHGVEVSFGGFDYLGVWTSGTDAPFVAIEPWCGVATCYDEPDVFEAKRGTIVLAPGKTCEKTFYMRPF